MDNIYKDKIFIVGRAEEEKAELIKDVYIRTEQHQGDIKYKEDLSLPFKLDNKYFSANLTLWNDNIDQKIDKEALKDYSQLGQHIDAFLYTFVGGQEEHVLSDIKSFMSSWKHHEIELKFCVLLKHSNEITKEDKLDPILDWCVENQFEFIDLTQDSEEDGGVPRIIEALNAHTWQGLIPKVKGTINKNLREDNILNEFMDTQALPSEGEIKELHDSLFKDEDNFESSLNMLKNLREHAKELPMDERRKLAAKVALSFGLEMEDLEE